MIDELDRHRLCIPKEYEKMVLAQAHDYRAHCGEYRVIVYLNSVAVIRRLTTKVRKYIKYCPTCQLTSQPHHKPFGDYTPIVSPNIPFYTVSIDFIVALPPTKTGLNMVLVIVDKASKAPQLIEGKDTYTAQGWGKAFAIRIQVTCTGYPAVIISDRDPKFTSGFWEGMWKHLGTKLLMTTAYHPSANGQVERMNQMVESCIRVYLFDHPKAEFTDFLPALQFQLFCQKS